MTRSTTLSPAWQSLITSAILVLIVRTLWFPTTVILDLLSLYLVFFLFLYLVFWMARGGGNTEIIRIKLPRSIYLLIGSATLIVVIWNALNQKYVGFGPTSPNEILGSHLILGLYAVVFGLGLARYLFGTDLRLGHLAVSIFLLFAVQLVLLYSLYSIVPIYATSAAGIIVVGAGVACLTTCRRGTSLRIDKFELCALFAGVAWLMILVSTQLSLQGFYVNLGDQGRIVGEILPLVSQNQLPNSVVSPSSVSFAYPYGAGLLAYLGNVISGVSHLAMGGTSFGILMLFGPLCVYECVSANRIRSESALLTTLLLFFMGGLAVLFYPYFTNDLQFSAMPLGMSNYWSYGITGVFINTYKILALIFALLAVRFSYKFDWPRSYIPFLFSIVSIQLLVYPGLLIISLLLASILLRRNKIWSAIPAASALVVGALYPGVLVKYGLAIQLLGWNSLIAAGLISTVLLLVLKFGSDISATLNHMASLDQPDIRQVEPIRIGVAVGFVVIVVGLRYAFPGFFLSWDYFTTFQPTLVDGLGILLGLSLQLLPLLFLGILIFRPGGRSALCRSLVPAVLVAVCLTPILVALTFGDYVFIALFSMLAIIWFSSRFDIVWPILSRNKLVSLIFCTLVIMSITSGWLFYDLPGNGVALTGTYAVAFTGTVNFLYQHHDLPVACGATYCYQEDSATTLSGNIPVTNLHSASLIIAQNDRILPRVVSLVGNATLEIVFSNSNFTVFSWTPSSKS